MQHCLAWTLQQIWQDPDFSCATSALDGGFKPPPAPGPPTDSSLSNDQPQKKHQVLGGATHILAEEKTCTTNES